jgi:hypothetical protein
MAFSILREKGKIINLVLQHISGAKAPGRVGAGEVWRRVGTLASPLAEALQITAYAPLASPPVLGRIDHLTKSKYVYILLIMEEKQNRKVNMAKTLKVASFCVSVSLQANKP